MDMQTMERLLKDHVTSSKDLVSWIDDHLQILSTLDRTDYLYEPHLVIDCLSLARENHKAAVILVEGDMIGPASSLVRVAMEAYYRGVWLHRCAKRPDWDHFKANKGVARQMHKMIGEIKATPGVEGPSSPPILLQKAWEGISRFPHAGLLQIGFIPDRKHSTALSAVLRARHALSMLTLVDSIGIQSGLYTAIVLGDQTMMGQFQRKLDKQAVLLEERKKTLHTFDTTVVAPLGQKLSSLAKSVKKSVSKGRK